MCLRSRRPSLPHPSAPLCSPPVPGHPAGRSARLSIVRAAPAAAGLEEGGSSGAHSARRAVRGSPATSFLSDLALAMLSEKLTHPLRLSQPPFLPLRARGWGSGGNEGQACSNSPHLLFWQKVLEQKDLKPVPATPTKQQPLLPRSGQDTLFHGRFRGR